MVAVGSTPVVRISGLRTLTFYFPTRVSRQYDRPQRIPEDDTIRPVDKPMTGENPRRWETYWMADKEVLSLYLSKTPNVV